MDRIPDHRFDQSLDNRMPSMDLLRSPLKTKTSFIRLDDKQLEKILDFLEEEYDDIVLEYHFMDHPIKTTRPNSPTPTIDKILHLLLK